MTETKIKRDILDAAIAAVYLTAGILLKATPQVKKGNRVIDAEITIEGYKKTRFAAEVKKWAQQANFGAIVNQVQRLPGKGMLVADYVNPMMADRLRELEIPYIDAVGNVYINEKPLYILVKTTKSKANELQNIQGLMKTQARGRAFNTTGLKVIYQFLINEELLNATYRDIASKADVALGTVGLVFNDLRQGKFLLGATPKQRRLVNKRRLLDKWVDAYLEKLRPRLAVGTFTAENPEWWLDVDDGIVDYGAKWGGEIAAQKITGYLKPQEVIIYLEKGKGTQLFNAQRFRKDPTGDIHVYRAFWKETEEAMGQNWGLVNPVIAYADLIGTGDPRNLETAKRIYGEELAEFVGED